MFERYTERARQVVVIAQQIAKERDAEWIGTGDVLLGIVIESQGLGSRALAALNLDEAKVRHALEPLRSETTDLVRDPEWREQHLPFTPLCKTALENALREALSLGNNYIGTEHVLLGLLRGSQGDAVEALAGLTDAEKVRQEVVRLSAGAPKHKPLPSVRQDFITAVQEIRDREWGHSPASAFDAIQKIASLECPSTIGPRQATPFVDYLLQVAAACLAAAEADQASWRVGRKS